MQQDVTLKVPWGQAIIRVRRTLYERWLSWGACRKQAELEGIGWLLIRDLEWKAGHQILRIAFGLRPRLKALTRLIRAWCLGMGMVITKFRLTSTLQARQKENQAKRNSDRTAGDQASRPAFSA